MATPAIPGIEGLGPLDRARVMEKIQVMQMQESVETYNGLVHRCFSECVTSFRSKVLDPAENACLKRCVQKNMAFNQRLSMRFAEKNQQQQMAAAGSAAAASGGSTPANPTTEATKS